MLNEILIRLSWMLNANWIELSWDRQPSNAMPRNPTVSTKRETITNEKVKFCAKQMTHTTTGRQLNWVHNWRNDLIYGMCQTIANTPRHSSSFFLVPLYSQRLQTMRFHSHSLPFPAIVGLLKSNSNDLYFHYKSFSCTPEWDQ